MNILARKWGRVLCMAVCVSWMVAWIVYECLANEMIQYYSSQPHRLLYVAVGAVTGGLAVFAFDRLAARTKRLTILSVLGGAATAATGFVGYMLLVFWQYWSLLDFQGCISPVGLGAMFLMLLVFPTMAGILWRDFYHVWKKK